MASDSGIGRRSVGAAALVVRAGLLLVGAVVTGVAIPAFWLWVSGTLIASLGGTTAGTAGFVLAVTALAGLVASYVAMVWIVGLFAARRTTSLPQRFAWNRSLRAGRHEPPVLNRLEKLFIAAALMSGVAYIVWTVAFPRAPFPLS